jgi:prolyl-tRNA synthetase
MFLRPTSETPMYTMFSLWVRSHTDLPLKTFQIVNTFRYETKQTRSFIRVREIHFFEAHTVHSDEEGATKQIAEDASMVQSILHDLCLPNLVSKRPIWDTFPGAWYTMAADVVMPNGRTLQVATYHHYRDQWARSFDLKYEDSNGETKFCHQTTFGMSERLLGSVVGMHGDDQGLIMPPAIAPFQVILLPIAAHVRDDVTTEISKLKDRLSKIGIRTHLDDRDVRPGVKHFDWEIKGAPIRLELGPRDIDSGNCVITERTGNKYEAKLVDIEDSVNAALDSVSDELRKRANESFANLVKELPDIINSDNGYELSSPLSDGTVYSFPFCGNDSDAEVLEKLSGLTMLGECVDQYPEPRNCVITGNLTTNKQHIARMY